MSFFIDITLGLIFLVSLSVLWFKVSEKIPKLSLVPDSLISQSFKRDSAKIRLFLLHLKSFYKEKYYRDIFFDFLGKTLHRLHIVIMRLDNIVVSFVKRMKVKGSVGSITVDSRTTPSFNSFLQREEVKTEPNKIEPVPTLVGAEEKIVKRVRRPKMEEVNRPATRRRRVAKIQTVYSPLKEEPAPIQDRPEETPPTAI